MRALAITAALALVASVALWSPLAAPSRILASAMPWGPLLVPLALAVLLFAFRRAVGAILKRASVALPAQARFLVPPLVATLFFAVSWSGSHLGHEGDVGILPQIAFPAVSGVFAFAVARWGAPTAGPLAGYLRTKERVPAKVRLIAVIVLPILASLYLTHALSSGQTALAQQLVVGVGLVIGYLIMAPARPTPGAINR